MLSRRAILTFAGVLMLCGTSAWAQPPDIVSPAPPALPDLSPPAKPAPPVLEPGEMTSGGLVGGIEGAYLKFASAQNSPIVHETQVSGTPNTFVTSESLPFTFDYTICPRFWIGYVNSSGFGFRARYENYDLSSSLSAVQPAQPANGDYDWYIPNISYVTYAGNSPNFQQGDTVLMNCHERIRFIDGEVIQQTALGRWKVDFGGGLRYASFQMDQDAWWTELGALQYYHNHTGFDCIGPTLFAELKRPLGYGLAVLTNVRGAFLFGTSNTSGFADIQQGGGTHVLYPTQNSHDLGVIFGQVQVGLEWSCELPVVGGHFLSQALWEAQILNTGSNNLNLSGYVFNVGLTR